MIVVYPLLITDTVSPNIVPGISKILERYLLIYKIDDILKAAKTSGFKRNLKVRNNKLIIKEDEDSFYTSDPDEYIGTGGGGSKGPKADAEARQRKKDWENKKRDRDAERKDEEALLKQKDVERKDEEALLKQKDAERKKTELDIKTKKEAREKKKASDIAKSATMDIGAMDMQSITAEPTWVKVDVQIGDIKRTELIGIKVVPTLVKSSEKLVRVLMFDKNVKGLQGMVLKLGRKFTRQMWSSWDRLWSTVPFFGSKKGIISGDARKDILLRRTLYANNNKANIFLTLNFQDLDDELFFNDAKSLNKLFKKGWDSFVVCDDVNRIAHFCMREFKGMATSLNYAMMYQTLGQFKVYESLEDVKKSSSALFKRKMKVSKLFSKVLMKQKLNKYRKI